MEKKTGERGEGRSKYKGVRKRKWGKWVSEIRLPNSRERIWLGSYDTPEKAARAFDAAVLCLRGKKGGAFNFPQHLPDIPLRQSLPPSEVQAVASRFANESPPSDSPSPASPTAESGGEEDALDWSFLDSAGSDPAAEISGAAWPGFYDAMEDHLSCEFSWPAEEFVEEQTSGFLSDQSSSLWDF